MCFPRSLMQFTGFGMRFLFKFKTFLHPIYLLIIKWCILDCYFCIYLNEVLSILVKMYQERILYSIFHTIFASDQSTTPNMKTTFFLFYYGIKKCGERFWRYYNPQTTNYTDNKAIIFINQNLYKTFKIFLPKLKISILNRLKKFKLSLHNHIYPQTHSYCLYL